jgi:hypothetical protein
MTVADHVPTITQISDNRIQTETTPLSLHAIRQKIVNALRFDPGIFTMPCQYAMTRYYSSHYIALRPQSHQT